MKYIPEMKTFSFEQLPLYFPTTFAVIQRIMVHKFKYFTAEKIIYEISNRCATQFQSDIFWLYIFMLSFYSSSISVG